MCANVFTNSFKPPCAKGPKQYAVSAKPLNYREKDEILLDQSLKKVFKKHFTSWMYPFNVALNVSFKTLHIKQSIWKIHQNFSDEVDIQQLAWKRLPLKSYFTYRSNAAPCLFLYLIKFFWNSVDNHNKSCEHFIGRMSD